ncbi:diguanylate cyclase [Azoarcus sp. L1K30]|uniref:diguanylate cyclase domain-containing protein n=1 Tax=Azoarcus sp. L1K30 TaxID=2820277 RepID=UPI001B832635|nr:diguanylate cyclase [Azoarcus sp. L1K30]
MPDDAYNVVHSQLGARMRLELRQRWMSVGLGLLGLIVAGLIIVVGSLFEARLQERGQAQALSELSGLRARLEGELNGATNLTAGLVAEVAISGRIGPGRFAQLARELMQSRSLLRNITLAPDNVIAMVYPLAGNEAAVGLDLLNHPIQGAMTRRMLETGHPVLAGPVELVQGGLALIHRVPIFLTPPGGAPRSGRYWGLMSTPINFDRLLADAGLLDPDLHLALALRGVDGAGRDGAVFWGRADLFDRADAVQLEVRVLDGSWVLAAVPLNPPAGATEVRWWSRVVGVLCAVFALLLSWHMYRTARQLESTEQQVRHLALHDSLTGLANRVLLEGRFRQAVESARREGHKLALLYLDLDDFKPINDQYGHEAGDHALRTIAGRMEGLMRQSDTVARVGGDEFVILLNKVSSLEDAFTVGNKLAAALAEPLQVDGHGFELGASIGVAVFPDHAAALYDLMRLADQAMYRVKGRVGCRVAIACDPVSGDAVSGEVGRN